jgi:hypothetical protein
MSLLRTADRYGYHYSVFLAHSQSQLRSSPASALLGPTRTSDDAKLPDDVVKVETDIYFVPSRQCILKIGKFDMSEAKSMQFVATHTSIPEPNVLEANVSNSIGYNAWPI